MSVGYTACELFIVVFMSNLGINKLMDENYEKLTLTI